MAFQTLCLFLDALTLYTYTALLLLVGLGRDRLLLKPRKRTAGRSNALLSCPNYKTP